MLDIRVKTVPHESHRYPTIGDWQWKNEKLTVRVSEMNNWEHELLVAVHELVESYLCRMDGVPECLVGKFDRQFEKQRKAGDNREPGEQKDCPYREQHLMAEHIEHSLCEVLGVKWKDYIRALEKMP